MDEAMKKQQAQKMYNIFCQTLDANDWKYKGNAEELKIECGAQGDDLPMELVIVMKENLQNLQLLSRMPYKIPEDKRLDVAVAISDVNNRLVHGGFDYHVADGNIYYRMVGNFSNFLWSQEICKYMLFCACKTIDEYNDKFLMVGKGIMSLEAFLKAENE